MNLNNFSTELENYILSRNFRGIADLLLAKLPFLVFALVLLLVGFLISDLVSKGTVKILKAKGVDPSIHNFIKTIISFVLKVAVFLAFLSALGINVNSLVAALAAGGVAAGLGFQQSISQFASGMLILINRPFKSGDFIDIGTVSGTVKEIRIMYTTLITLDNRLVIVPNSTITSSNVINFNAQNKRRIDLTFAISYSTDIDKAREALLAVIERNEMIFKDPMPFISVGEHGQSSINLACLIWCNPRNYWPVFYYMQEESKKEFDRRGITIPFNQLDVHINQITEKDD